MGKLVIATHRELTEMVTSLRAENEKLRARILELEMFEQFAGEDNAMIEKLRLENETHKEIAVRETMKNATLRAALKPFLTLRKSDRWETGITETTYLYAVPEAFLRAAAAALKETDR